jgi:hypothetical protein
VTKRSNIIREDNQTQWAAIKTYDHGIIPMQHSLRLPDDVARFAMKLLLEMSKTPFDDGGEDSVGRQKGRRLTGQEIVDRAFEISVITHQRMEQGGHYLAVPSLQESETAYVDKN